jgi:hypothetical protein
MSWLSTDISKYIPYMYIIFFIGMCAGTVVYPNSLSHLGVYKLLQDGYQHHYLKQQIYHHSMNRLFYYSKWKKVEWVYK